MTVNVSSYPLCAKRLHFQRANLSDPMMTHYWAAVCVADELTDEELAEHGGINFGNRSPENGKKLMAALEAVLLKRQQKRARGAFTASDQLRAMLGARGVKTSMLHSEDDYWTVAETLFPGATKRDGGMQRLHQQMLAIPKKERKRLADANLRHLKPEWLSGASAHLAKLQ